MNSSKATDYVVPEEFVEDTWLKFSSWINSISAYLYLTDFVISFIGIFPSLFHFWVHTRTSMRHLTTNLFLIGITVCGIIHMICNIVELFPMLYEYYLSFKVPLECSPFASYSKIVSNYYSSMTNAVVTGMLTYFTVAMAIIRFLVVKFPFARGIQRLIYSKSGLKILLLIIFLILPLWAAQILSTNIVETGIWVPGPNCDGFPENYTEKMYTVETSITFRIDEFYWILYYIDAVFFQFIPSILLPISTVLLIVELKKNKKTKTWTSKSQDRSTKLVIYMTISFTLANAPYSLIYSSSFMLSAYTRMIISQLSVIAYLLTTLNVATHWVLCYFMSTQYRNTVRMILGKNNIDSGVMVLSYQSSRAKMN